MAALRKFEASGCAAYRQDVVVAWLAARISAILRDGDGEEAHLCARVALMLATAIRNPDWISPSLRTPTRTGYRRERLYEAKDGAFSIGCFAWGVGQQTPIHDHRGWCVIGCAAGTLESIPYELLPTGRLVPAPTQILPASTCHWSLAREGDIHRLRTGGSEPALSVHVYGVRFAEACGRQYLTDGTVVRL